MKSKAMVVTKPGHMELQEFELQPTPADHVLVKAAVTSVCSTDLKIFSGHTPVGRYPLIMGHEIACEVVEVGSQAARPVIASPWNHTSPADAARRRVATTFTTIARTAAFTGSI